MGLSKGDTIVWYQVTRHPQVFRGLTVGQRTPGFLGRHIKSILANVHGRICLTSNIWTVVTTQGYMAVTNHYVDK